MSYMKLIFCALAVLMLVAGCGRRKAPNVILISIDTLRADHLGSYGYPRDTSPALDQLAADGLLFEDVSAPAPWTLPSHASMLTGLYPNRHGLKSHEQKLPAHVRTIAMILKEHGFDTAAIVNSHNLTKKYGFDRGFNYYKYVEEKIDWSRPSEVEEEAIKWLSKPKESSFFLFLHYYDVHSDYTSLSQYEDMFVRPYSGIADGTTEQLINFRKGLVTLNMADVEHLVDLYDAGIRQMDDGIKRLLQFLNDKKMLYNTLIVVTSDHGEEFLEHGGVLHGQTYYQEVINVPLIIKGPHIPHGRRIKRMVSLVDVMPTLLGLLNVPIPESLDGIDLRPTWQQSNPKLPSRFVFAEADHNIIVDDHAVNDIKRLVRDPRYKLHYDRLKGTKKLYDLQNDPKEKQDLATQETEILTMLREQLDKFMRIEPPIEIGNPLSQQEIDKLKSLGYMQ